MSLRMSNVLLQDSDPTNSDRRQYVERIQQFKQSIEARPLRFAFIDGKIESICPSNDEEVWALNIKRGVISALQNTMTTLQGVTENTETDVLGTCPVKYVVVESNQGSLKLKKMKNLIGCKDRSSTQSILQSVAYQAESDIQDAPLLKGTHLCEQEIDVQSKIIKKVECMESHVFKPFSSRDNSGATTNIKYRLVFQRNAHGSQPQSDVGPNKLPLLFDHTLSSLEMESNVREAQQLIATLCRQTTPDVRPEAPNTFSQLVKQMRGLDQRNLRTLLSTSQSSCTKAEQFYRDAITVLATPASVSIIRDLITRNQVSKTEADLMLTSLSFIQNPTSEMMSELKNLLQSNIEKASLPVSSVVYSYIKQNPAESQEVNAIMKIFEDQLKYNCRGSGEEDKAKMLLALRAIGNAGKADRLATTLDRCAANDQAPMSVRVAAIQAYRRVPCSVSREQMFRMFANKELDSELRINAYLVVMQCADVTTISRLHGQLNSEVVNQVGSFVWTHLTNLAESSSPLKSDIREIISDPKLLKEFDIDKRKFSRNIELSTFSNYLNLGGSIESNIIMSSKSYIPRSVGVNLTVDLFGESINLLEVGTRAQGLEAMLEKYFGPESDLQSAIKREKRAVVDDHVIQHIDRQYSVERDQQEVSYFLRIFGNEIKSGDISDFSLSSLKGKLDATDILGTLAQQRSIDFTRSYNFIDSSLSVPSGIGMAVKLGIEGTITVGLTASGKVDVRRMFAKPSHFEIVGSVRPSTAVEIQGEFGIDAHVTMTKLRISNRLHSSTMVDGRLSLKDGQVFNFDWNMPAEKLEIFSAESHFYISHRGREREQVAQRKVEYKKCFDEDLSTKLGWELCGEVSYPNDPTGIKLPTKGPSAVKVYINKRDTFTSARVEASFIRNQAEKTDTARFSFNTPGSRIDREVTADFKLDRINKDISLKIKSPWKRVTVSGQLQSDAALKKASLMAMVDDNIEYSVTAEVRTIDQKNNAIKYIPSVKIVWPERQPITLEGQLTYIKGRRAMGNAVIKNAFSEPITIDGSLQMVNRTKQVKYDVNMQFSSPVLRGSVVGYAVSMTDRTRTWASRLDVNYQYRNNAKQRIVLNNKVRDTSSANLNSYTADGSWSTTMWPQYNGRFEFRKSFSANSVRTTFDAGFDSVRKITIVQSGAYDFNGVDKKLNAEVKVELPYYRINYETKINHIHNWDALQSNVSVKYDENKEHTLDIGMKKDTNRYLNAIAEARLKLAGRDPISFTNTLIERAPRQYHNVLRFDAEGRSLSAIGLYKMGQRHELNADIQATGYEPISISGHLNPNIKNIQAKVEVKYGRRNYMGDINWLYRSAPGAFNIRGGAEIGYLSKKYGLTTEISRVDHNVSATIQAMCGFDRKVSLSAKLSASPTNPELRTRIEWPQNFIDVLAAGKYSTQDWIRTPDDLVATLKITTGFQGYEDLGGEIKMDVGQDSLRSNGHVIWGRYKRITGDLTYGRNRVELNVATPFYGYRTVKANASWNKRGTTYDINGGAEWEQNRMRVTGRMTHERGNGMSITNNGELNIQGPWERYREAKLSWRHQNDDGTFWKCHHELEFERQPKYIIDIDASQNRISGRSQDVKVKATFTSPIRDWEHVAVNWDSNHDLQTIRSRGMGSIVWGGKNIGLEHELSILPYAFIAKAKVTTPFNGYEAMGFDMNNRLDSRSNSYTLKNEILLGEPEHKVGLDGKLVYDGPSFDTGLRLTTPHPNYPRMAVNLRNGRQQDGTWALHGDLEVRRGVTFTLDGKLGMRGKYGAELSMTSPYESLRSMTVKAMGSAASAKRFEGDLEVSHNLMSNKAKLALDVSVETMDSARASLTLETPWSKVRLVRLAGSHTYQTREKCLTTLSYDINDYRAQLTHEQNVRSARDFDGKTRIEYGQGQVITLDHRVSRNDANGQITASLTTPFNEARAVDLTINLNGPADNFRSTVELVINRRDRINGNFAFSMNPQQGSLKASAGLTTPYQSARNLQAAYEQSGSPMNHRGPTWDSTIDTSFQLNDKRWWTKRTFSIDNQGVFKFNAKAQMPDQARPSEFNLEHTPKDGRNGEKGWSSNAFFESDGLRYTGVAEYVWRNEQQLSAKIIINGPQEEFSVILDHRNIQGQVTTELSGKAGHHGTGTLSYSMNPGASNIQLTANVQSQYRNYERFDFSLKHEGPANNFKTVASLQTSIPEYRRFNAELSHRGPANDFNCQFSIETPFNQVRSLSGRLSHKMTDSGLQALLEMEYSGKRVQTGLNYNNDGRKITVTGNLETPYPGYESFAVEFEHTGNTPANMRTTARLTTPFAKFPMLGLGLELTAPRPEDVRAKVQFRVSSGESSATYSHNKNSQGDLNVNLEVITPYSKLERSTLSIQHQQQPGSGGSNIRAEVTTSVPGYERFSVESKHEPTSRGFKSTGKLETSIQNYNKFGYEVEFSADARNVRTNVKVETPFVGYDKFEGRFDYASPRGSPQEFRVSTQVTTPINGYRNFGLSVDHNGPASNFQTRVRVTTPFRQAAQIDITLKHRGISWTDFSTGFEAQYSGKKIDFEGTFKYHEPNGYESDYSGSVKINTPCPYLQNLEVAASHNRKPVLKGGALTIHYNGNKKVDFDYSYTTGGPRRIIINLKDPYTMGTRLDVGDSTGSAVVDWDPMDRTKQIRFDFGLKDIKTDTSVERLLSFKTSIPNSRIVGFLFSYSRNPGKFTSKGELYWDRDSAADFTYELEGQQTDRSSMYMYDGSLKVTSDSINFDTRMSHKSQQGRKYETELSAGRLTLKSDLTVNSETDYQHILAIKHPRLTQDATVTTEVKNGNSFKSTFSFDRQTATLEGSFSNDSRGPYATRYNGMVHLQHPNSQTDIKLSGMLYSDAQKLGGNIESQYKTSRDRQIKTSNLKAEIDRIRREISAELITPLENFKLKTNNRGVDSYGDGVYKYDVIASVGRNEYKYTADVSTKDRSCDVKLYDNNDYIQIFTQFFSPLHSQIDISRTLQGRKHNDVQISLSMNDERIIKGKAYIRPQLVQDVSSYFQNLERYPPALVRSLTQSADRLSRAVADEWQQKKRMLEDSLRTFIELVDSITRELKQKAEEIRTDLNAAYYRNDFYIKDIHQALKRHYEDISQRVQYKMAQVRRDWDELTEKAKRANKVVLDKLEEINDAVAQKSSEIKLKIDESIQKTNRYFDEVSEKFRRQLMEYIHSLENNQFYRDYALMKPSDFLLPPEQWMDKLKQNFARVMAKIESDLDQYIAKYKPQIEQLKQKIFRYLQENQEMFRKLGLEAKLRELMYKMQMMTWPQLKTQIKQAINEYFQWEKTRWTVWDPQRGEYSFEAYVPVDLPDFSSVVKVYNMDVLSSTRSMLPDISIPSDWTFMDVVNAYRPGADISDWVPPFKAHATVTGNQHYMTFDRKFYEFAGECSYLLARDFVGKTFSVIVNYERTGSMPTRKSLTVLTDGRQVEISRDGKLTVDGRRSEMPVKYVNTTVSREGNAVIVSHKLGLQVVCDLKHDHCTVSLSGWYYGKTAGMLGTYDNEHYNDFITSDKTVRDRPEDIAEAWTVGARCRTVNNARLTRKPEESSEQYKACAELFEDETSVMRGCFRRISPQPYMDMCLNDNMQTSEIDVCSAAAAYHKECKRREVHIRMPAQCVQCEVPLSRYEKFIEGETKKFEESNVPKSADVVFVVQHAQCNRDVVSKIRDSIDDMVKAFTAQGLREVRYAVVGFGGSDHQSVPHIHTMDGQIFAEASRVSNALSSFSTDIATSYSSYSMADAMGALAYSAKLPFRAGVSKSLVLLACDSCQELTVRYSDVQRILLQTDIHLHVLTPQLIRLKSRSPKTSLIFGVDDETVYTSKDVSDDELSGESDLRKYVRLPKDLCVALTHETDGSVFSSAQWTQAPAHLQKKFTDVFARSIALKAEPTDCQQCECVADEMGAGVAHCSSCYQKNPIFSLLPNFNDGDYSDDVIGISNNNNGDDDDDDDDDDRQSRDRNNNRNAVPQRPPKRGDRVTRPRRPTGQRPDRVRQQTPQRIPGRPEVKDQ